MNSIKRITAFIAAVSVFSCLSVNMGIKVNALDNNNDDWLHCKGDKIYDMYGNEVWLTGANWFGFNCGENSFHGSSNDVKAILKNIADRGIGLLRVPISTELLYSWMTGKPNKVSSVTASNNPPYFVVNPDFYNPETKDVKDSMQIFDYIMGYCKELGIKVMVDVHSPDANNSGHNYPLWYGLKTSTAGEITTDKWIDTLVWLADKYKNDDTIIALDLKNEPHGKREYSAVVPKNIAKWDNTTDENNWKYASEKCSKAILEVNPKVLIMIEGVEQYPKTEKGFTYETPDIWDASPEISPWYGAWWGGNLRGVKDYPIDVGELNSQIVYSPHDYGPSVWPQTWFNKDFTTKTLLDDYWYDSWAYIDDKGIAPLLIGEWGGPMGGKNQKWMELLRDYMIEKRINHTFWCINPNSGDTGGLTIDFVKWDEGKYALLKPALWQDKGKFIGLDHQIPLGKNGVSLGEYYGNVTPIPPATPTTPTTPVSPDITPNGNTIFGYISPDISVASAGSYIKKGFNVELSGTLLNVKTDEKGFFEIKDAPQGLSGYTVKISKEGYLSREIKNVSKNAVLGSVSAPLLIWAGDIKMPQDGVINMTDVIEVAKAFNTVSGDEKYSMSCDVTSDGSVNMTDIIAIAKHFNATTGSYTLE